MKTKRTRNPYGNTKKRKATLAWMAARGITQPRALYPVMVSCVDIVHVNVDLTPVAKKGLRLV